MSNIKDRVKQIAGENDTFMSGTALLDTELFMNGYYYYTVKLKQTGATVSMVRVDTPNTKLGGVVNSIPVEVKKINDVTVIMSGSGSVGTDSIYSADGYYGRGGNGVLADEYWDRLAGTIQDNFDKGNKLAEEVRTMLLERIEFIEDPAGPIRKSIDDAIAANQLAIEAAKKAFDDKLAEELTKNKEALEASLAVLDGKLTEANGALKALEDWQLDTRDPAGTLRTEITNQINAVKAQIEAEGSVLDSRFDTVISNTNAEVNDIKTVVIPAITNPDTGLIKQARDEAAQLTSGLRNDVESQFNSIQTDYNRKIEYATDDIEDLSIDLKGRIATTDATVSTINTNISSIQGDLSTVDNRIETASNTVKSVIESTNSVLSKRISDADAAVRTAFASADVLLKDTITADTNTAITNTRNQIEAANGVLTQRINDAKTELQTALAATNQSVNDAHTSIAAVNASLAQEVINRNNAINAEASARADAIVNGVKTETDARVSADSALNTRIDTVVSTVNTNDTTVRAYIDSKVKVVADANGATVDSVETLRAAIRNKNNLLLNSDFKNDLLFWSGNDRIARKHYADAGVPANAPATYVLRTYARDAVQVNNQLSVVPGDSFYASMWAASTPSTTVGVNIFLQHLDKDGNTFLFQNIAIQAPDSTGTWHKVEATYTIPANTASVIFMIQQERSHESTNSDAAWYIAAPELIRTNMLTDLKATITDLRNTTATKDSVSAISGRLTSVESDISTGDNSLTKLRGSINNLETSKVDNTRLTTELQRVTNLEASVNSGSNSLDNLRGSINNLQTVKADTSTVSAIDSRVVGVENEIYTGANSLTSLRGSINNVQSVKADSTTVSALDSRVVSVENDIRTGADSLSNLRGSITSVQNTKADSSTVSAIDTRVQSVESQIGDANSGLTKINARITNVESTKADNSALTAAANRVSALEASVNTGNDSLSNLRANITDLANIKADATKLTSEANRLAQMSAVNDLPTRPGKWLFRRYPGGGLAPDLANQETVATDDFYFVDDNTTLVHNIQENYNGRLTTNVYVDAPKNITFSFSHDDGCRLFVNRTEVYAYGLVRANNTITISLPAGWSTIDFLWQEGGGDDGIFNINPVISTLVKYLAYQGSSALSIANDEVTVRTGITNAQATRLNNLESSVNTGPDNLSNLRSGISNLQTTKADNGTVSAIDSRLVTAEGKISNTQGDVSSLSGRVSSVESVKADKSTVSAIDGRLVSAEGSITSINGNVSNVTSRVGSLESSKADLSALTAEANRITELSAKVGNDTTNMIANAVGDKGLTGWDNSVYQAAPDSVSPTGYRFAVNGRDNHYKQMFNVTPGERYYLSVWCAIPEDNGVNFAIGIRAEDKNGTNLGWTQVANRVSSDGAGSWRQIRGTVTIPAGMTRIQPWIQLDYSGDGSKTWLFTKFEMRPMAQNFESEGKIQSIETALNTPSTGLVSKVDTLGVTTSQLRNDVNGNASRIASAEGNISTLQTAKADVSALTAEATKISKLQIQMQSKENLIDNGDFRDGVSLWSLDPSKRIAANTSGVPAGAPLPYVVKSWYRDTYPATNLAVTPGDTFYTSMWAAPHNLTTYPLRFMVFYRDRNGTAFGYEGTSIRAANDRVNTWVRQTGNVTVPPNAVSMEVIIQQERSDSPYNENDFWFFTAVELVKTNSLQSVKADISDIRSVKADASTVNAVAGRVTNIESDVNSGPNNLTSLRGSISNLETSKVDNTKLATELQRVSSLEASVNNGSNSLSNLRAGISSLESSKADASTLSAESQRINNLDSRVGTSEGKIGSLESTRATNDTVSAINSRLVSVEGSTSTNDNNISNLQGRVGTIEGSYVNTTTLAVATDRISSLESSVNNGTSGIGNLNARLGTVENTYVNGTTFNALANRTSTIEGRVGNDASNLVANHSGADGLRNWAGPDFAGIDTVSPSGYRFNTHARDNVYQVDIPVTAGEQYYISGWFAAPDNHNVPINLGFRTFTKDGTIGHIGIGGLNTNDAYGYWRQLKGIFTVPDGVNRIQPWVQIAYFGSDKTWFFTRIEARALSQNYHVDNRLNAHDGSIGSLDGRVGGTEGRLNTVEPKVNVVEGKVTNLENVVTNGNSSLVNKVSTLESNVNFGSNSLGNLRASIGNLETTKADASTLQAEAIKISNLQTRVANDTSNMIGNSYGELGAAGWLSNPTVNNDPGSPTGKNFSTTARDNLYDIKIKVAPGEKYYISTYGASPTNNPINLLIGFFVFDKTDKIISYTTVALLQVAEAFQYWKQVRGILTVPDNAAYIMPWVHLPYNGDGSKEWLFTKVEVRSVSQNYESESKITSLENTINTPTSGLVSKVSTLESNLKGVTDTYPAVRQKVTDTDTLLTTPTTGLVARVGTVENSITTGPNNLTRLSGDISDIRSSKVDNTKLTSEVGRLIKQTAVSNVKSSSGNWLYTRYTSNGLQTLAGLDNSNIEVFYLTADQSTLARNLGDNYLGRLTTNVYVDAPKSISFTFSHDDGCRVYLNGGELYGVGTVAYSVPMTLNLPAGWSTIDFIWEEGGGDDGIFDVNPPIGSLVKYLAYAGTEALSVARDEVINRTNAVSAVAQRTSNIETSINDGNTGLTRINSRIGTLETSKANTTDLSASNQRISNLESNVNDPNSGLSRVNARVGTIEDTYVNQTTFNAVANRTSTLEARIGNDTTNMVANPSGEFGITNWDGPTAGIYDGGSPSSYRLELSARDNTYHVLMPVVAGEQYYISAYFVAPVDHGVGAALGFRTFSPNKGVNGHYAVASLRTSDAYQHWVQIRGIFTVPVGVTYMVPWLQMDYFGNDKQWYATRVDVRPVTQNYLVDSRITSVENAISTPTTGYAARISNIESAISNPSGGLNARISNIEGAYVNTTTFNATASKATQLEAVLQNGTNLGNYAKLTEINNVSVDGRNKANAIKGVSLDVNGRVSGWTSVNDGTTADFIITADRFKLFSPNGGDQAIFAVGNVNGSTKLVLRGDMIADGSITASRLAIGSGVNLIPNSDFRQDWTNWHPNGNSSLTEWAPYTIPGQRAVQLNSADGATNVNSGAAWVDSDPIKVVPGQYYFASVYYGNHRTDTSLTVIYYDNNNTQVGANGVGNTINQDSGGNTLDAHKRLALKFQVPSNAAYVVIRLETYNSGLSHASLQNQYVWYTMPMLEACDANTDRPSAWTNYGVTLVDAGTIRTGTINADRIASQSIVGEKIAVNTLHGNRIIAGSIVANHIAAGQINTDHMSANSIDANRLVARSITADRLASKSISANELQANVITSDLIAAGAITADKIAVGSNRNLLPNTEFDGRTTLGWTFQEVSYDGSSSIVLPGATMQGNDDFVQYAKAGTGIFAYTSKRNNQFNRIEIMSDMIPAYEYLWYAFGANLSAHRVKPSVSLAFFRGDGSYINEVGNDGVWDQQGAFTNVPRFAVKGQAPAGTRFIRVLQRGFSNGDGNVADCYLFASNAMLEITDSVKTPSPYQPSGSTLIDAGRISTGYVAADRIDANVIRSKVISAARINAGDIITEGSIYTNMMVANSINGDRIAANTLNANKIVAGSITASQISAGAIESQAIKAGAITGVHIAANSIEANMIKAGAITANSLGITSNRNLLVNGNFNSGFSGWTWNSGSSTLDPNIQVQTGVANNQATYAKVIAKITTINTDPDYNFGTTILRVELPTSSPYLRDAQVYWDSSAINVNANQYYYLQAMFAAHRTSVRVEVDALNSDGSINQRSTFTPAAAGGGRDPAGWANWSAKILIPSGATKLRIRTVIQGPLADYPVVWATNYMIENVDASQSAPSNYISGGSTAINGNMIRTGVISASLLDVEGIRANIIAANVVGAQQIVVTQAGGTVADSYINKDGIFSTGMIVAGNGFYLFKPGTQDKTTPVTDTLNDTRIMMGIGSDGNAVFRGTIKASNSTLSGYSEAEDFKMRIVKSNGVYQPLSQSDLNNPLTNITSGIVISGSYNVSNNTIIQTGNKIAGWTLPIPQSNARSVFVTGTMFISTRTEGGYDVTNHVLSVRIDGVEAYVWSFNTGFGVAQLLSIPMNFTIGASSNASGGTRNLNIEVFYRSNNYGQSSYLVQDSTYQGSPFMQGIRIIA